MKTIINEEIQRIRELMGVKKDPINEQWWKIIDDLLTVTKKDDDFFKKIAEFGGKTVDELEAAVRSGDDILETLGKGPKELADFLRSDKIIFKKFADEFLATSEDVPYIKSAYYGQLRNLDLSSKEEVIDFLQQFAAKANRDGKLGDTIVLSVLKKNIDETVKAVNAEKNLSKIYKSPEDFINSEGFKSFTKQTSSTNSSAFKEFVKNHWDDVKIKKNPKEAIDYIKSDSGILTTTEEKIWYDKFLENWSFMKGLKIGGGIGGIVIVFGAAYTAALFAKCFLQNRGKYPNPVAFCYTKFGLGTLDSMLEGTEKTDEDLSKEQKTFTNDITGFTEWCAYQEPPIKGCDKDEQYNEYFDENNFLYYYSFNDKTWKRYETN